MSTNQSKRKELLYNIFGSDSEDDGEREEEKDTFNIGQSELDDDGVLDINIDFDNTAFATPKPIEKDSNTTPLPSTLVQFITPTKLQQLTKVWPVISPIGKTPEQAKRPLFATSPYSIRIQTPVQIRSQNVQIHNHERYEQYLQQQEIERVVMPLKQIYSGEKRDACNALATTSAHTKPHISTCLQTHSSSHSDTQARWQNCSLASHAHTRLHTIESTKTSTTVVAPSSSTLEQRVRQKEAHITGKRGADVLDEVLFMKKSRQIQKTSASGHYNNC